MPSTVGPVDLPRMTTIARKRIDMCTNISFAVNLKLNSERAATRKLACAEKSTKNAYGSRERQPKKEETAALLAIVNVQRLPSIYDEMPHDRMVTVVTDGCRSCFCRNRVVMVHGPSDRSQREDKILVTKLNHYTVESAE